MDELQFLKNFQEMLKTEEYDCVLIERTEENPYDRLLVFLGLDEKDREKILEITALKQELIPGAGLSGEKEPAFFRVQFQVGFPFSMLPESSTQVSSLVCYLNRLIELPGFEMNEIDLQLFYRYVLLYGEEKFNKKLFASIVGMIMLTTELFGSTLEKLSSGEMTFNAILEQIIEIGRQIKP